MTVLWILVIAVLISAYTHTFLLWQSDKELKRAHRRLHELEPRVYEHSWRIEAQQKATHQSFVGLMKLLGKLDEFEAKQLADGINWQITYIGPEEDQDLVKQMEGLFND